MIMIIITFIWYRLPITLGTEGSTSMETDQSTHLSVALSWVAEEHVYPFLNAYIYIPLSCVVTKKQEIVFFLIIKTVELRPVSIILKYILHVCQRSSSSCVLCSRPWILTLFCSLQMKYGAFAFIWKTKRSVDLVWGGDLNAAALPAMPPPRHIAIETVGPRSLHGANAEQHGGRYETVFLTLGTHPVLFVSSIALGVHQLVSRLFTKVCIV